MTADEAEETEPPHPRVAPGVVAPTNRINVALPFSKIQVDEPSKDLGELAALVAELAAVVERVAPGEESRRLQDRADRLAAHLR
jgi:hypothetical protein